MTPDEQTAQDRWDQLWAKHAAKQLAIRQSIIDGCGIRPDVFDCLDAGISEITGDFPHTWQTASDHSHASCLVRCDKVSLFLGIIGEPNGFIYVGRLDRPYFRAPLTMADAQSALMALRLEEIDEGDPCDPRNPH